MDTHLSSLGVLSEWRLSTQAMSIHLEALPSLATSPSERFLLECARASSSRESNPHLVWQIPVRKRMIEYRLRTYSDV